MTGDNKRLDNGNLLELNKKAKKQKKSCCCTIPFLECVLHIYNVVFSLAGLGVLAVGVYSLITRHRYVILLPNMVYTVIVYAFISCGALSLPLCALGTGGVKKKNRTSLLCYVYFMLFTFLAEAGGGWLAYHNEMNVERDINNTLNATFLENYNIDAKMTKAIDELQDEYSCCGSHSYYDWRVSTWKMATYDEKRLVPDSCCKSQTKLCGVRDHPSNINYKACAPYLIEFIREPLTLLAAVGLGTSIIPLFGVVFSCWLYMALTRLHA